MLLKMAVCPHDVTKKSIYWINFVVYLSKKTGIPIRQEYCLDFDCYYKSFSNVDMTYSNPMDALKIHKERGFIPIAGNTNYDEVVILAHKDRSDALEDINGNKVLMVKNQFASYLGQKILMEKGINFIPEFKSSWQEVVNGIIKGEAPYGFVYKDFWEDFSDKFKENLKVIYESDERLSSHLIMLSPEHKRYKDVILSALLKMHEDPEGRDIMSKLNIAEWYPVNSLENIETLLKDLKINV